MKNVLLFLLFHGICFTLAAQYEEYMKKIGESSWTSYVMYADPDGNLYYVNISKNYLDLMKYDLDMDMVYKIKDNFIDTHDGYNTGFGSIAPTPDGDTVYCMTTAGTNHGNAEIFRLICSQDKFEYLTDICGTNLWQIFNMSLSKDGKALYYIGNNTPTGKSLYKIDLETLECEEILDLDPIIPHRDLCFGGINVWDNQDNFYLPVWSWDYDEGDLAVLQVHTGGEEYSARVIDFTDDGTPSGARLLPGFRHHSCWSGICAASNGNIYIAASNHYQIPTASDTTGNVAMYTYDPVQDKMTLLGDLESVSKSVNNWMPYENQHKVHTFLLENADKKIYFASLDYESSYFIRGSHLYTIDIETDEITDYSKNQTYIMNRDFNVIENGDLPSSTSGVFIEYYGIKGIALHPGTPDVLYAMTFARSESSGGGYTNEKGNVIRYSLESDFTKSTVLENSGIKEIIATPNPFKQEIYFDCSRIRTDKQIVLQIFDMFGRLVMEQQIFNESIITWNGMDRRGHSVPPGLYLYRINSGTELSGKIIKIK